MDQNPEPPLEVVELGDPQTLPRPPRPRRTPLMIIAWLVLGFAVVCCLVQVVSSIFVLQSINGVMSTYARPVQTATLFYSYMQNGRYEDARGLLTPGLSRGVTADTLRAQWQAFLAGGNVNVSCLPQVNEPQTTITVFLDRSNGRRSTVRLTMVTPTPTGDYKISSATPALVPSP